MERMRQRRESDEKKKACLILFSMPLCFDIDGTERVGESPLIPLSIISPFPPFVFAGEDGSCMPSFPGDMYNLSPRLLLSVPKGAFLIRWY